MKHDKWATKVQLLEEYKNKKDDTMTTTIFLKNPHEVKNCPCQVIHHAKMSISEVEKMVLDIYRFSGYYHSFKSEIN